MKKRSIGILVLAIATLITGCTFSKSAETIHMEETTTEVTTSSSEETESAMEDTEEEFYEEKEVSEIGKLVNHGDLGQQIKIENPSWDYYKQSEDNDSTVNPMVLEEVLEEQNEITDEEAWLSKNQLDLPFENGDSFYCEVERVDYSQGYILDIYDLQSGILLAQLDFSDYRYANDFKEQDREFAEQLINWTDVEGTTLYLSIGHNTYAETSPHNAYIMAIDLTNMEVLWKTEPLICNSNNFIWKDGIIICGYGFTAEKDYLYQINASTGEVIDQIPLKSMAEYIIQKDNKLYVRTYHTNYVFEMK